MAGSRDDGGPAFPFSPHVPDGHWIYSPELGMSLRDWFAGQALAGLLANDSDGDPKYMASRAYYLANEMLDEKDLLGPPESS